MSESNDSGDTGSKGRFVSGVHEVRWCFHTTAMVSDYESTRDALIKLLGLRVLEDSRIEDPAIGRRGGMAWVGDNVIEIGESIVEGGAVDRFVQRFGPHMSSIAVQVSDIDATVGFLEAHDVEVGSRIDGHIVFTKPGATAGVVVEWFGDEEKLDPRFGAIIPPYHRDPILNVTAMAFGGAIVKEPTKAAARLAQLFGREVTFDNETSIPGMPRAGVSMGDMTLALYDLPEEGTSESLWGWNYSKPQTSSLGVLVPSLAEARQALAQAKVNVIRHETDALVIDPKETGGVVIVVIDKLLPGDPRLAGNASAL